ncbi:MAG: type II toxin-antitoxin system HicA family toxin [bacterium]
MSLCRRKIRQLIKDLEKAGFISRGGKGDHRNYLHEKSGVVCTISGNLGDDAKPYQEKLVIQKIRESQK